MNYCHLSGNCQPLYSEQKPSDFDGKKVASVIDFRKNNIFILGFLKSTHVLKFISRKLA